MAETKLTKHELRLQQTRLSQLQRYLPTLQLKKAMLQMVVMEARQTTAKVELELEQVKQTVAKEAKLVSHKAIIDFKEAAKVLKVKRRYENIAGVEVPFFEGISFAPFTYSLFATPPFVDQMIFLLREAAIKRGEVIIAHERKEALEHELREVSIRVNLFEKILIPRALSNIKKIRVFLSDQQQAAVSRAKVAKAKIEKRTASKKEPLSCASTS